jgi:hypothetical protein
VSAYTTERCRELLHRASDLAAKRYEVTSDAAQNSDKWARLAIIDKERAALRRELEHIYHQETS